MLRKQIIEVTPDYDLSITIDIPEENYFEVLSLPIDVDFFWPRVWIQAHTAPTVVLYTRAYAGVRMDGAIHYARWFT